jgi:anthranilate/para-aminobenzoate synthase component I
VWRAGEVRPAAGGSRQAYERAVARALEYIRAGDVYQVNLAHPLEGAFTGSARALASRLLRAARPWYGAYLEQAGDERRALISASPESFLAYDARTRRVETRPMKGTRAGAGDPRELERNDKERAELNMIVDLMRNDLGRVCELGSVRVDAPRDVEAHGAASSEKSDGGASVAARTPGVLQATATVSGTLRAGLDLADLLWATFPPGSVTGAPKVRAMQIIDELEPAPRGPYCGAIGWVGADGSGAFSVAIRTAEIRGLAHAPALDSIQGTLRAWVGAGIVADSLPPAEWEETIVKAWALRAAGLRIEA